MKKTLMFITLLCCSGCWPRTIPELTTDEYFYKTVTMTASIDELQKNLFQYDARCGLGVNPTFRTINRLTDDTAILSAQNGNRMIFVAKITQQENYSTISLYGENWRFMEHFCNALNNGECIDSYYDSRLMQQKN